MSAAPEEEKAKDYAPSSDTDTTDNSNNSNNNHNHNHNNHEEATTMTATAVNNKDKPVTNDQKSTTSSNTRKRKRKHHKAPSQQQQQQDDDDDDDDEQEQQQEPDIEESAAWREKVARAECEYHAQRAAQNEYQGALQALEAAQGRLRAAQQSVHQATTQHARSVQDVVQSLRGPWRQMYQQLQTYHAQHGTCRVRSTSTSTTTTTTTNSTATATATATTPGQYKDLLAWTKRQRQRYHAKTLPWYLVECLNQIQFPWNYREDPWKQQYQALNEYKALHGDCCVPRGYKPNPALAHWVKRMRYEGAKFRKNNKEKAKITATQVQLLNDIGFVWQNLSRTWQQRLDELCAYKEQHGHANVPASHVNTKLVTWCQNQRAHHRAFLLGKKTYMTAQRKEQLEAAGFDWDYSAGGGGGGGGRGGAMAKNEDVQDNYDDNDDNDDNDNAHQQQQQQHHHHHHHQNESSHHAYPYHLPQQQQQQQQQQGHTLPAYAQPIYANPPFRRSHYGV